MTVTISTTDAARLVSLAAADPCHEVCGLLLGEGARIDAIVACDNVAADRARRFEVDPAVLIATLRAARAGAPNVIGCWHSHPSGRAEPSAVDAAMIGRPGEVWLIVAAGAVTAWIATGESSFQPVALAAAERVGQSDGN